jgi:phosphatidylserine/phosphatidylglycerophosphate/cardiolipin synthase-like enzyme
MGLLGLCQEKRGDDASDGEVHDDDALGLSHVGEAAYEFLRTKHHRQHHSLWNVTSGKVVGKLHQTPVDAFVPSVDSAAEGHSDWFPKKLGEIVKRTEVWCDIMSLAPPDGLFMTELHEAFQLLSKKATAEQPITVRLMCGNIVGMPVNCTAVIKALTKGIDKKTTHLRLWVGAWRKGISWNHAKLIAVDGKYLHTGGHNMWDPHYLKHNPVHDLSIELEGRCTHDGHLYANAQWAYIQRKQNSIVGAMVNKLPDGLPLVLKSRVTISEFPHKIATVFAPMYYKSLVPRCPRDSNDEVPIITMGRYGKLLRRKKPSDDAIIAMILSAKTMIRMALQDLGPVCIPGTKITVPGSVWPKAYLNALGKVMWEKGVDVEIVLSNPASIPGGLAPLEASYGNGWTCVDVAAELIKRIRKQFPKAEDSALRKVVTDNLRVTFLRQEIGKEWDDGMTMALHTKHFIVDDVCTYIGSQNLYISDLAEWGVVIDSSTATKQFMEEYWNPMWTHSYRKEDCDVQAVMDGLAIDRDGEDPNKLSEETKQKISEAGLTTEEMQGEVHRPTTNADYYYDNDDDDKDDDKPLGVFAGLPFKWKTSKNVESVDEEEKEVPV